MQVIVPPAATTLGAQAPELLERNEPEEHPRRFRHLGAGDAGKADRRGEDEAQADREREKEEAVARHPPQVHVEVRAALARGGAGNGVARDRRGDAVLLDEEDVRGDEEHEKEREDRDVPDVDAGEERHALAEVG